MIRKFFSVLMVLLVLRLFTGCGHASDESVTDFQTGEEDQFAAYNLTVNSSKLAVHSGPGYSYDTVTYITDQGSYLIVAEEIEKLTGGAATVWGKIHGVGWINLEDAQANSAQPSDSTEPSSVTETTSVVESTSAPKPVDDVFEPYVFALNNPWVEIYSGPGYNYQGVDSINGGGAFTIVEAGSVWMTRSWIQNPALPTAVLNADGQMRTFPDMPCATIATLSRTRPHTDTAQTVEIR